MAKNQVIGIVLAAGDGTRMGGSKALLEIDGDALVRVHAARLREGGCQEVLAVVRRAVIGDVGVVPGARVLASDADEQAGSLAVAMHEHRAVPDAIVVVTPVDAAPVGAQTVARLVEVVAAGAEAATPKFETKSGHPVVCRRRVLDAYRGSAPYPPLRDVVRGLGDKRAYVDVADPRVAVDLDTPEDVRAFTGSAPRFVGRKP